MSAIKKIATIAIVAAAGILLAPFNAKADSMVTVTLTGVNGDSAGGVYTSPYYATVGNAQNVLIVCDDFDHEVYIGESWTANVSTLSDLSQVRFDQGSSQQLKTYEEAAWLFDQLPPLPPGTAQSGATMQTAEDISFAIWALFPPYSAANTPAGTPAGSVAWLSAAAEAVASPSFNLGNYSNIEILTPENGNYGPIGSPQEYLMATTVPTPEPSSLLLLGVGMIGAAIFLRWKHPRVNGAMSSVQE